MIDFDSYMLTVLICMSRKQKFMIVFEKDSETNLRKILFIIDYNQSVLNEYEKHYSKEDYVIKELDMEGRSSPEDFYAINNYYEWYTEDGFKYNDFELYLKGLLKLEKGLKYDNQGNLVMKTDDEKMLDGEMELPEDKEIYNGKIRTIPYFHLKKEYYEDKEKFFNSIKSEIKNKYDINYESLINLDGILYQCNSEAVSTLLESVSLGQSINWRAKDNTMHLLDVNKAKILAIAMQKSIQSKKQEYFSIIDSLKKEILDSINFEEIILKIESILGKSLNNQDIIDQSSSPQMEPIESKTLEENLRYLDKNEAKQLINKKEIEKVQTRKQIANKKKSKENLKG